MAFSDPVVTPSSGETLVNGVLWDHHWSDGSAGDTKLAFYIAGTSGAENFDFGGDNAKAQTVAEEAAAFRLALQLIEDVCNIDFVEVNSVAQADVILAATANGPAAGSYGIAVPPGEDPGANSADQGAVLVNYLSYESDDYSSLQQGGYDFITFIHELGHAIGLKHPHDRGGGTFPRFPGVTASFGDYGDFDLNQGINTMMSYNDGWAAGPGGPDSPQDHPSYGWQGTPMALDIAALQYLYGANTKFHTGDDVYTLPSANKTGTYFSCIWDAGGTDTIAAGSDADSIIDLREATIAVAADGGGNVSYQDGILGGFTIARNAVIENALGGRGKDQLIGNDADNELKGSAGTDNLSGGDGSDRLLGEGGRDKLTGGFGQDLLNGGGSLDRFIFRNIADSTDKAMDRIAGFEQAIDLIDLENMDAKSSTGADDAFSFIGSKAFTAAGQLRFEIDTVNDRTYVQADVDGGGADFQFRIDGQFTLTKTDFIL